jgi:hypothetical protein
MEGVAANICRRIKVFSSVTTKRVHLAERTLQANDVVRRYGDGHRNNRERPTGRTNKDLQTFTSARPAPARDVILLFEGKKRIKE